MAGAILDRQGRQIEVTDLDKALTQANQAIAYHRKKTGIVYPEVLKDWEHISLELTKIKNQRR